MIYFRSEEYVMTYHSRENQKCYFPPLLSNGDMSFAPEADGGIGYRVEDYHKRGVRAFDGIIIRSGRRSALCNTLLGRLFPMGTFRFLASTPLAEWSQTLSEGEGTFESTCIYADGEKIYSKGFIHPDINLYALQKKFTDIRGTQSFSFDVSLSGYNESISKYMEILRIEKQNGICRIQFKMYGMDIFLGEIHFFVDKEYTVSHIDNGLRLSFDICGGEDITFYYYLADNLDDPDYTSILDNYKTRITESGFSGLLRETSEHYKSFYALGYVKTSDDSLNAIYRTSLYSIKCNTTKHSIAVGHNNGAWDGKYFAFDEYASYLGLLGANRLELAKRVPSFRLHKCLPTAITRASDPHRTPDTEDMAFFLWVTGENGNMELARLGSWLDHIFHIPLIGIGAFEYFEYSGDRQFLEDCYPMIRACSKFMTKRMLYKDGDRFYIGKCTDLERLGASVTNPFMTACGAIKLLECCAKSANILGTDEAYAKECTYVAQKLRENLPQENGRYVPFLGCNQKSIAVFAGKYPFDVLHDDDEKLFLAWEDFEDEGNAYGNMYPVGKSISPWYACWKAESYARSKMPEKAYVALKQSYASAGVFGEMFEINEEGHRIKPWFSTAAGIFISTVNEMLLQSDGNTIKIMPGMPHTVDVSFKLAAKGGITVEAEVKNKTLTGIAILKNGTDVTTQFHIEF